MADNCGPGRPERHPPAVVTWAPETSVSEGPAVSCNEFSAPAPFFLAGYTLALLLGSFCTPIAEVVADSPAQVL